MPQRGRGTNGETVVLVEGYNDLRELTVEHLHSQRVPVCAYDSYGAWRSDTDSAKRPGLLLIEQWEFEQHRHGIEPERCDGLHVVVLAHAPLRVSARDAPNAVFMKPFSVVSLGRYIQRVLAS